MCRLSFRSYKELAHYIRDERGNLFPLEALSIFRNFLGIFCKVHYILKTTNNNIKQYQQLEK
jgi:hypothetical protein